MNEVFLDTETTCLSYKDGHKIFEIACIETEDLIPTGKPVALAISSIQSKIR